MNARQRKKAVAVAKDVIEQLRIGRLISTPGCYVSLSNFDYSINKGKESFRSIYRDNSNIECSVCAIGAAFIGYVNQYNNATLDDVFNEDSNKYIDILSDVFSRYQLRLMERIYEGRWEDFPEDFEEYISLTEEEQDTLEESCDRYRRKYPDATDRLRAIMLNVVRNNGEFVLPKRILQPSWA